MVNFKEIMKIRKNMLDDERYEILKNKSLEIYPSREDLLSEESGTYGESKLKNINFKTAKIIFKKLVEDFNLIGKEFKNTDIELDFELSHTNLKESLDKHIKSGKSYNDFKKLMTCFDEVIENAKGIEIHDDYKPDNSKSIKNIYVLVSAFYEEENIYPVKLLIKEYEKELNCPSKLYVAVSLERINKKEVGIVEGNLYSVTSENSSSN